MLRAPLESSNFVCLRKGAIEKWKGWKRDNQRSLESEEISLFSLHFAQLLVPQDKQRLSSTILICAIGVHVGDTSQLAKMSARCKSHLSFLQSLYDFILRSYLILFRFDADTLVGLYTVAPVHVREEESREREQASGACS
jgi:hypothetical protein